MSEETTKEGTTSQEATAKTPTAEELAALKAEAAERRITAKKLQEELDAIKAKQSAAEEEAAKKRGEFEQLYTTAKTDAESFKTKAERAESALAKFLEAEMTAIPEDKQALIPEGDAASKLEWIGKAKAAGLFTIVKGAQPPPATRLAGEQKVLSLHEQLAEAKKNNKAQEIVRLKREIHEAENK